jgi:FeS assembly SUF system protein
MMSEAAQDMTNNDASLQPEATAEAIASLGEKIVTQIRTVYDPEIPVNLYDLGLIYRVDVKPLENGKADVEIDMTLTTPNCPVAGNMPVMVSRAVEVLDEINDVKVNLVWEPVWDKSLMSDEAKLQLNMF